MKKYFHSEAGIIEMQDDASVQVSNQHKKREKEFLMQWAEAVFPQDQ